MEERQIAQWPKEKGQKDKQLLYRTNVSIKTTHVSPLSSC